MDIEDELLVGALDTHAHGYPEFTLALRPRVDNVEWARRAAQASMRGFVMKSHLFPTTAAVQMLRALTPELETFSSITLNPPAGGLSPLSVEIAAQSGAKVVWMPTWSVRSQPSHRSIYLDRMGRYLQTLDGELAKPSFALDVVDADGALRQEVQQIIGVCKQYGMTIASGHLPIASSITLAAAASAAGVRFILTHPLSGSVNASIEDQLAIAAAGGWIEHVFIGCMPMHQRTDPNRIVEAIRAVGAQHCIMASDAIETWNPPEPEIMRMFIATMLALGVSRDDVYAMTHTNPARALGLSETWHTDD